MNHVTREKNVVSDLEASFPDFTGRRLSWVSVPDGRDPPDFVADGPDGSIGLELIEWLDGDQMGAAKKRESLENRMLDALQSHWRSEYRPERLSRAWIYFWAARPKPTEEAPLVKQFFACAAEVDRTWDNNSERAGKSYLQTEFPNYPVLTEYVRAIRYVGGNPSGQCWFGAQGRGGPDDPSVAIETMRHALASKLERYATAKRQAHLRIHALAEFYLLVHGGFNIFAYNMHGAPLEETARQAAAFYAAHPQREVFKRVWFFNTLDGCGHGSVRWLAQLWPDYWVHPNSISF